MINTANLVRRTPPTQDQQRHLVARVEPAQDAVVFTFEAGGLVSHANWYRSHCRPAVKRAGLPDDVRYHDLRHTYARLLIAEGAHPRAITERLGHSSIQVTLGTYGHLFPTLDEALTEQGPQAHDFSRGSRAFPLPGGAATWMVGCRTPRR
jgi:integrase